MGRIFVCFLILLSFVTGYIGIKGDSKDNTSKKHSDTYAYVSPKQTQKTIEDIKDIVQEVIDEYSEQQSHDISVLFTDEEMLSIAQSLFEDFWRTYWGYQAGTIFDHSEEMVDGYYRISDERIRSMKDVLDVYHEKFSTRYPVTFNDSEKNIYKKAAFIEKNGAVYEMHHVDGIIGESYYLDHIVKKSSDEFWVEVYAKDIEGNIRDTGRSYSFVYENGRWYYGDIVPSF